MPSTFCYQQFRKAAWINTAAVSLNYQGIKMYLWTTKDRLAELLFSALFHGEMWGVIFERFALEMPSEHRTVAKARRVTRCRCRRRTSLPPCDLQRAAMGAPGQGSRRQRGTCVTSSCVTEMALRHRRGYPVSGPAHGETRMRNSHGRARS